MALEERFVTMYSQSCKHGNKCYEESCLYISL